MAPINDWATIKAFALLRGVPILSVDLDDRLWLKCFDGPFEVEAYIHKTAESASYDEYVADFKDAGDLALGASQVVHGKVFSHAHTHTLATPGATYYHMLRTPDTVKRIHYRHIIGMTGSGRVEYYEAGTVSADGSSASKYNRDRNSLATPDLVVTHSPTVTTDGTMIEAVEYATVGGNKQTNSFPTDEISLVLKQNTIYLVKYISSSSGNVFTEMHLWTEV